MWKSKPRNTRTNLPLLQSVGPATKTITHPTLTQKWSISPITPARLSDQSLSSAVVDQKCILSFYLPISYTAQTRCPIPQTQAFPHLRTTVLCSCQHSSSHLPLAVSCDLSHTYLPDHATLPVSHPLPTHTIYYCSICYPVPSFCLWQSYSLTYLLSVLVAILWALGEWKSCLGFLMLDN